MNRREFLERVNRRVSERGYGDAITWRTLRDWISPEELVPGPKRMGRKKVWGCVAYRRVLQVCRIKSRGADRFEDIRTQLWLRGIDPFSQKIRLSIIDEFERTRKRTFRKFQTDRIPKEGEPPSARDVEVFARRVGISSENLSSGDTRQSIEAIMAVHRMMRFGDTVLIDQVMRNVVKDLELLAWLQSSISEILELIKKMGSGLAGAPDEVDGSADQTLRDASPTTFMNAREILRELPWLLRALPATLSALAPQAKGEAEALSKIWAMMATEMQTYPFRLQAFVQFVHWAHRQADKGEMLARVAKGFRAPHFRS